jgi:hypothetical protein
VYIISEIVKEYIGCSLGWGYPTFAVGGCELVPIAIVPGHA